MKKWIMVVIVCLLATAPVMEASAAALQPSGTMVLVKKLVKKKTKKKSTKKKSTKKKSSKKKSKVSGRFTKKKSTTASTQAASSDSENTSANNIPVDDVIMDGGSIAPDMTHIEDDEDPALVFTGAFNNFLTKYKGFVLGVAGVIDLFLIGVVISRIIKLGAASQSPVDRKNALTSFGISLLAVAIMGSITLWYGLFFNALK